MVVPPDPAHLFICALEYIGWEQIVKKPPSSSSSTLFFILNSFLFNKSFTLTPHPYLLLPHSHHFQTFFSSTFTAFHTGSLKYTLFYSEAIGPRLLYSSQYRLSFIGYLSPESSLP